MREIKFRAWIIDADLFDTDKETPYMEYDFAFEEYMTINDELQQMQVNGHNLMQYTGLKDKNGTEIYEGDIVKVSDDYGNTDFTDGGIGTVCGMEDLFMWYIDGDVHNGLYDVNQSSYIEVIGNIYENKKLLQEESE